jgi:exodeoxyribonuclease VIII
MDTNKMYHQDTTRISKSGLDLITKAPAYYYAKYLDPNRVPEERTEALINGHAAHGQILEPDKFAHQFIVQPKFSGTGSVAKRAEWEAQHADKEIITLKTYNMITSMRSSVQAHPVARELLSTGEAEKTLTWMDPLTGAPCKSRQDWFNDSNRLIVDLKSTEDASDEAFRRSAFKYRYHVQAAFYLDGARACGLDPQGFVFIAVEKKPPFLVNVFYADEEFIEAGRQAYRNDLEIYMHCVRTGVWPGYEPTIKPLSLPAWAITKSNQ